MKRKSPRTYQSYSPGFLLRFEVAGTNVSIAGTKDGGRAAILARSAKSG